MTVSSGFIRKVALFLVCSALIGTGTAHAAIDLRVAASCPEGGSITISWDGATPHGHIAILWARHTGETVIPIGNTCAGTTLAIRGRVKEVIEGLTGASGSATIMGEARPGACGGQMQLMDFTTCDVSNVAPVE